MFMLICVHCWDTIRYKNGRQIPFLALAIKCIGFKNSFLPQNAIRGITGVRFRAFAECCIFPLKI